MPVFKFKIVGGGGGEMLMFFKESEFYTAIKNVNRAFIKI